MSRDPDGRFAPRTPEDEAGYKRWISLYERPEPQQDATRDSPRRSSGADSSRWAPCAGRPRWRLTWTSDEAVVA